ncbi:MAG: stage IV sporulation protein A [Lachnospiraceae bacterium]
MSSQNNQEFHLYKDIQMRTGGEIYIGVIGPVRTGKSTLIKRMMDVLVLPNLPDGPEKMRIQDELPQSGAGRTITTTEPKFLPKDAFDLKLFGDIDVRFRLIDCVGYMVDGATGHMEEDEPRLVKTPWSDQEIPFVKAAEIGTRKVMEDHSTIGIVVTCDGSFSDIPRESYIDAEKRTITEMKNLKKPFVVVLNSIRPYSDATKALSEEMERNYQVPVLAMNCEQLKKEDITHIFERILMEFPIADLEFFIPKWVEMLPNDSDIKTELLKCVRQILDRIDVLEDVNVQNLEMNSPYVSRVMLEQMDLSNGKIRVKIDIDEKYYYEMISEMTGASVPGEYELLKLLKELSEMKKEYVKVQYAIDAVRQKGYGVVMPIKEEIALEEPALVRQGNKYGVRIRAVAPSIHMIRANIETDVSPLVGNEQQAGDLIRYIKEQGAKEGNIWSTNIFGKTVEELVEDGIKSKVYQIGEESQAKLQETMQKIVNDSNGGMVCIII